MGSKSVRSAHSIDVWRLFAAFLVVCVHFPLPGMAGGIAITYAKTAVPFFIIVSGYFCYRVECKEFQRRLRKQIVKMAILCVIANVLYFRVSYYLSGASSLGIYKVMQFRQNSWKDFWLVNESPFAGHLWFLGSMVYALVIMYVFTLLRVQDYACFLAPLLLGVYIVMARSGKYDFLYCRNAVFCTMPYFMYGCLMRRYEHVIREKLNKKIVLALLGILIGSAFIEFYKLQDVGITFISPELLVIILVIFLIQNQDLGKHTFLETAGRRDTLFIYIMHMIPLLFLYQMDYNEIPWYMQKFGTVIIFLVTLLAAELFHLLGCVWKMARRKLKK